ncbi:hypothetical protein CRH09_17660 [Nocardia terpenica]|uniref:Uncharacterized protein n=2 Tax=Nocardia terpenica TaxID=455432 RepID=A0A291RJK1_9NOCA|nr:hypothetical protein CRH09_17660 [Nocardia terpenica]
MPHVHTITRAPLIATGDSGMTVELDGLRVRLDPSTPGPDTDHGIGALVNIAVDATYPTLSPGFFLAKGSRGQPRHGELIRLYIHLESADAAVAAWSTTIGHLEQQRLPYQAKVLSNPQLYPRHDSLVVYLGPEALRDVHTLTEKITTIGGLGEPTSLFAEQLAPGISIAWEPRDSRPGMAGLSFGQHRATAIAEGIVRHAENQHPELNPADTVTAALLQAGINPANPARNIT